MSAPIAHPDRTPRACRRSWSVCTLAVTVTGIAAGASSQDSAPALPPQSVRWPNLTVNLDGRYVDVKSMSGICTGWLEQVACLVGTREHEAVIYVKAAPSLIHAALLLLDCEPGTPGRWKAQSDENGMPTRYTEVPPTGSRVAVNVVYTLPVVSGSLGWMPDPVIVLEVPVTVWVIDYYSGSPLPADDGWVFGGSRMFTDYTGQDRYTADVTGSVVGIVTFGDELLGYERVIPDAADVADPEWIPNRRVMPPFGSSVLLRLRPIHNRADKMGANVGQ